MKHRPVHALALSTILSVVTVPGAMAQAPSIRDWDLVCFCSSRVRTPHFIVQMDNNGEILYAARSGTTRERLQRAGVHVTESQLRLLQDWGLLSDSTGQLRATIPIFPPEQTLRLRAELRTAAHASMPRIRARADTLVALIARQVDSAAAWASVFSYVLDGLTWDSLIGGKDLVSTDITVDKPYWNGAFWALAPRRQGNPGTNSGRADDSTTILLSWTQSTLPRLEPLGSSRNRAALMRAMRSHDASQLPADLAPLGLLRNDGSPAVVIIREGQPIATAGRALAGVIARDVAGWMRQANLAQQLGVLDPGMVTLVSYHEYMWELLDALVETGILKPPAIVRGNDVPATEIRRLVTVVVK